ncbi:unnamed protein product [Effrenium voratum]|nr:unnamed protein product [Effrenium voratum]
MAEGWATALSQAFHADDEVAFIDELQKALLDSYQHARAMLAAVKADSDSFGRFGLRCLARLLQAEASAGRSQSLSLLADLGPGNEDEGGGQLQQLLLQLTTSSAGEGLKLLVRVCAAWGVRTADQLGAEVRAALEASILRGAAEPGGWGLAAVAAAALPGLAPEVPRQVLQAADDGSRDEAVEQLAKGLDDETKRLLVKQRQAGGRLRAAAKAVQALGLQEEFPDAELRWKAEALEAAIRKGRKEAMVGLSCQEPSLHAGCVEGLLKCGEVELAADLAAAWGCPLPSEDLVITAKRKREAECLCLPVDVPITTISKEADVASLSSLLSAEVIGFDLESSMGGPGGSQPTLLQLASARAVCLVDLLAVGNLQPLALALEELFAAPMPKVGFAGASDLGKLAGGFPGLKVAAEPLVDLRDLEADRRAAASQLSKKKAREGVSLSSLAEQYLGKPLDKTFQVGDWAQRPLSEARAHYAALDAWVPVQAMALVPRRDSDAETASLSSGRASGSRDSERSSGWPVRWRDPEASPCSSLQERLLAREAQAQCPEDVYWESILVVLPCFSGYAALFGLQHEVKARLRIADDSSAASHHFGAAVSCLYLFGLIFRIGHKVVFSRLHPRARVHVAQICMMLSMLVMSVVVLTMECYDLYWVILAYSLGGAAMGSFESNLLNCLTPFGHRTKRLAILGIPLGVNSILIGGFFLMGPPLQVPVTEVFFAVAVLNLLGLLVFAIWIPRHGEAGMGGVRELLADCKGCRHWLPQLWHYPLAFAVDTFTLAGFSPGLSLYVYNKEVVQLTEGFVLETKTFFAFYNTANMLGGLCGRWLSYRLPQRHPAVYVGFNALGAGLLLLRRPVLAPAGAFLVMLGDGLIYGTISRHVDTAIPQEFNLIAISYWLFVGDLGSLLGSSLISYLHDWLS